MKFLTLTTLVLLATCVASKTMTLKRWDGHGCQGEPDSSTDYVRSQRTFLRSAELTVDADGI